MQLGEASADLISAALEDGVGVNEKPLISARCVQGPRILERLRKVPFVFQLPGGIRAEVAPSNRPVTEYVRHICTPPASDSTKAGIIRGRHAPVGVKQDFHRRLAAYCNYYQLVEQAPGAARDAPSTIIGFYPTKIR